MRPQPVHSGSQSELPELAHKRPPVHMATGRKRPADADAGTPRPPRRSWNEKEDRRAAFLQKLPPLFHALRATQGGGAVRIHPRLVVGVTAVMRTLQNTESAVVSVLIATKACAGVCLTAWLRPPPHPTCVGSTSQGVIPASQVGLLKDLCSA